MSDGKRFWQKELTIDDPNDPPIERRRNDDAVLEMIGTLIQDASALHKKVEMIAALGPRIDVHIQREDEFQKKVLDLVAEAFPNGDARLHRAYHEEAIARSKLRAAFWESMLFKLGDRTMWGFLAVAGLLITYWVTGHFPVVIKDTVGKG